MSTTIKITGSLVFEGATNVSVDNRKSRFPIGVRCEEDDGKVERGWTIEPGNQTVVTVGPEDELELFLDPDSWPVEDYVQREEEEKDEAARSELRRVYRARFEDGIQLTPAEIAYAYQTEPPVELDDAPKDVTGSALGAADEALASGTCDAQWDPDELSDDWFKRYDARQSEHVRTFGDLVAISTVFGEGEDVITLYVYECDGSLWFDDGPHFPPYPLGTERIRD